MSTNNDIVHIVFLTQNLAFWKNLEKNENTDVTKLIKVMEYFNLNENELSQIKKTVLGKKQEKQQIINKNLVKKKNHLLQKISSMT